MTDSGLLRRFTPRNDVTLISNAVSGGQRRACAVPTARCELVGTLRFAHPKILDLVFKSQFQTRIYDPAAQCARGVDESSAQRGRGERRMPVAPAASCALGSGRTHASNNEHPGITRRSRTQWF